MFKIKRFLSAILIASMTIISISGGCTANVLAAETAATVVDGGNCGREGDNVTWTLTSDGVLTLAGTGATADYKNGNQPWINYIYSNSIKKLVIYDGITRLGDNLFCDSKSIATVEWSNTLEEIGEKVFYHATCLVGDIIFPDTLRLVGANAFNTTKIESVTLGRDMESVGDYAFANNDYLWRFLFMGEKVTYISKLAFRNNYYLEFAKLPYGIPSVDTTMFINCKELDNVCIACDTVILNSKDQTKRTFQIDYWEKDNSYFTVTDAWVMHDCNATYSWNSDNTCNAHLVCKKCEYTRDIKGLGFNGRDVTSEITEQPTCCKTGKRKYMLSSTLMYKTYTAENEVEIAVDPSKHSTDRKTAIENVVDATYEMDGYYETVEYCTYCNKELSRVATIVPKLDKPKSEDDGTKNDSNDNSNNNSNNDTNNDSNNTNMEPVDVGEEDASPYVDEVTKYKVGKFYFVGKVSDGTMAFAGTTDKNIKSLVIPNTVTICGRKCKVTSITSKALMNSKKLKKLVINANVDSIGEKAFYKCSKLGQITIKGKKIKNVGKNAFGKIKKKCTVYIPKGTKTKYKKLFKGKGFKSVSYSIR